MSGEGLFQFRHTADGPLMVAGDVVGGGDGGEAVGHLCHVFRLPSPVLILQIAQVEDIVRLLPGHGLKKCLVVWAEAGAVEITEYGDAAAVEPGRQVGEHRGCLGHLQGGIVPPEKNGQ